MSLNQTIEKFGYPATLIREFDHWLILLRPAQVTLGSLVLAAKDPATAYSDLPDTTFAEQGRAVRAIEHGLAEFVRFERINYLMLMMVDLHVHFHVIPRYSGARSWDGMEFPDAGWPDPPELGSAISPPQARISALTAELAAVFAKH